LRGTVVRIALDCESDKSLRHDGECLTELLECEFFEPCPIQRIQVAEVGWESDNKGSKRESGRMARVDSYVAFTVLV